MKKIFAICLFVILLVSLAACAPGANGELPPADSKMDLTMPGSNPAANTAAENGRIAGLGTGLWHGLISIITLIISFTMLIGTFTPSGLTRMDLSRLSMSALSED